MSSTDTPPQPRRRFGGEPLLEPAAWVVLVVGIIASVLGAFVVDRQITERESDRLDADADALQAEFDEAFAEVQAVASEVSGAVIATGARSDDVERLMGPLLSDAPRVNGVHLVVADEDAGISTWASEGTVRALEELGALTIDPDQSEAATEALDTLVETLAGLETGRLGVVSTERVGDFVIVDLGVAIADDAQDLLLLVEMAVAPSVIEDPVKGTDIDYAVYLGDEAAADQLVMATTDDLPLSGPIATRAVSAGDVTGTLVVAASGALVTTADRAPAFLVLLGGLTLTGVATPVTHTFTRRRRQVRTLRQEKAELDEALGISRRIERELRASEERFRSVLTSSPDVVLWMDPEGTYVQVLNRDELFGHEVSSVERADEFTSLVVDEDWPAADSGFKALRWSDPGTITEFEFRLRDAAEEVRWIRARGGVAKIGEDESPYIIAVLTDVTEQKHEELRRAELENQLVQSQRLEAVGQLAGGVAHDFNNILAAILSGTELILDDLAQDDAREDVEEIQRTARRGADLSRQLLLFSRGEAGTSPEVLDVNEVVSEMERMLERSIGETVDLRVDLEDGLRLVYADKGEIERIIMNLVINARDAMDGGGSVMVRTANLVADDNYASVRVDLEPGDYVLIEVVDTGEGMPPDVVRRAFEPFFSTKDVGKGTGLGLATVYGIVQRARGHIEIDSAAGEGTTMRVLLPITRIRDVPDSTRRRDRAPRGAGERILVVEDEDVVRDNTRRLLERRGYAVDVAADGQTAAETAAQARYDLLLADVLLPGGMSGKDVADVLKRSQPHLAILFMTGHPADVLEGVGLRPGDPRIIRKPFEENQLLEMVRAAIDELMEPAT